MLPTWGGGQYILPMHNAVRAVIARIVVSTWCVYLVCTPYVADAKTLSAGEIKTNENVPFHSG
jgi:hypothetical protein